jgi:glycosyltransferase involved in cell wall biosynthesis
MRIAIATVQVPFISGGAEIMTRGLTDALRAAGHATEVVTLPFRFGPPSAVLENMRAWESVDFSQFDCGPVDELIALKFPAFYAKHSRKRVWLTHQHRSVYELFDTDFGDKSANEDALRLREEIFRQDTRSLSDVKEVFTISKTVSKRLLDYNGVTSRALYQPPMNENEFSNGECYPYIFSPSRIEILKRQELLVRAMAHVRSPIMAVIAGDGGFRSDLLRLIENLNLNRKVKLLGKIDHETMLQYYKHSTAVFFAPFMEDYGLVTLEAMLSAKPVITCTDSGGPTEFVVHGETGFVLEPNPEVIAESIDSLWFDKNRGKDIGQNGRFHYNSLHISWTAVVDALLR